MICEFPCITTHYLTNTHMHIKTTFPAAPQCLPSLILWNLFETTFGETETGNRVSPSRSQLAHKQLFVREIQESVDTGTVVVLDKTSFFSYEKDIRASIQNTTQTGPINVVVVVESDCLSYEKDIRACRCCCCCCCCCRNTRETPGVCEARTQQKLVPSTRETKPCRWNTNTNTR